jgi:DNA-binding transcriptional ArsR family regulator
VSDVARRIKMNYAATAKHLKILEEEDILKERVYGRVHMYRFNENSAKAKAIAALIEVWEKQ